jgi:hypothetical protein
MAELEVRLTRWHWRARKDMMLTSRFQKKKREREREERGVLPQATGHPNGKGVFQIPMSECETNGLTFWRRGKKKFPLLSQSSSSTCAKTR